MNPTIVNSSDGDNTSEITLKGQNLNEVKKWVTNELTEFLRMDYPEEWEDSLK